MILINYIIINLVIFLKSNNKEMSFENEKEARILLEKSRVRIDEIDNELCDLISERTSLAKDIVFSKQYY